MLVEKLRVVLLFFSDPRGSVSFLFLQVFVYISSCLIQLIFSSVTGKENFLTTIVPEGCLLEKTPCWHIWPKVSKACQPYCQEHTN